MFLDLVVIVAVGIIIVGKRVDSGDCRGRELRASEPRQGDGQRDRAILTIAIPTRRGLTVRRGDHVEGGDGSGLPLKVSEDSVTKIQAISSAT
jgi:hypothetical protein